MISTSDTTQFQRKDQTFPWQLNYTLRGIKYKQPLEHPIFNSVLRNLYNTYLATIFIIKHVFTFTEHQSLIKMYIRMAHYKSQLPVSYQLMETW